MHSRPCMDPPAFTNLQQHAGRGLRNILATGDGVILCCGINTVHDWTHPICVCTFAGPFCAGALPKRSQFTGQWAKLLGRPQVDFVSHAADCSACSGWLWTLTVGPSQLQVHVGGPRSPAGTLTRRNPSSPAHSSAPEAGIGGFCNTQYTQGLYDLFKLC
jgi:hypothetical protein